MKSNKLCGYPGCQQLTRESHCSMHIQSKAEYDKDRPSAAQRGYGAKWRKARTSYLSSHPLCVHCLQAGQYIPATVVDHIKPHKGNKQLFWDKSNWQSLCGSCHSRKTVKEDMGSW